MSATNVPELVRQLAPNIAWCAARRRQWREGQEAGYTHPWCSVDDGSDGADRPEAGAAQQTPEQGPGSASR